MTNLLTDLWHPNWDQFWPSIIATGIGFILAILFQQLLYEVIKNKIVNDYKAKNLIKDIKKELDRCIAIFDDITPKKAFIDPIKTPVWDGILNTNEFQLLTKYKKVKLSKRFKKLSKTSKFREENDRFLKAIDKKKHINLYDRLFIVYSAISDYNEWHNIVSDKFAAGVEQKDSIVDFLLKHKTILSASSCLANMQEDRESYKKSIFILSKLIACTINIKSFDLELMDINLTAILTKEDFE